MDRKLELRRVAERSLQTSKEERLDSPAAALLTVQAVRDFDPAISEIDAFEIVWRVLPS